MAQPFPYTYYSCSCVDSGGSSSISKRHSNTALEPDDSSDETFNPRAPRANFSLFPLEHLLYCTECHQIRCPRCITEEVVCWYCPSCLFEVPSSTVRSDGNRCTRNCYNCPVCSSFLAVASLEDSHAVEEGAEAAATQPKGPFVLSCGYCMWTSLEIGITFEKGNGITAQLAKLRNGGSAVASGKTENDLAQAASEENSTESESERRRREKAAHPPTTEDVFARLTSFYKQQMEDSAETGMYGSGAGDLNYASPSSISRLLNMYSMGKRAPKSRKPKPMRSAYHENEGLQVVDSSADDAIIDRMRREGWEGTASLEQLSLQDPRNSSARFTDELRPVATLLRTKRSKRCKTCRTLLSRPEPKVSTTRYKIRVLASTNLPSIAIRSLTSPPTSSVIHPLVALPKKKKNLPYTNLQPLAPHQFLLTITNPLFDVVHVTLATPAATPGRVQTKVTLLCPEFEVGANTDVWDEALNSSASAMAKRRSVMPGSGAGAGLGGIGEEGRQPEVGKIWEKGRNWTAVVMEVIPGTLPESSQPVQTADEWDSDSEDGGEPPVDDEDVIEIPVFVRVEYETEPGGGSATAGEERKEGAPKEKREAAFWCVLGVGRIVA